MTRKHGITSDAGLNPALRDQMQGLRGGIVGAAEATPLPKRFIVTASPNDPSMVIKDRETGRVTTVALCNYGGVRRALFDLFGGK